MSDDRRRAQRQQVLEALRSHLQQPVEVQFSSEEGLHEADLADVLHMDFSVEEAAKLFSSFAPNLAAEVLAEAEKEFASRLTEGLSPSALGDLLGRMSADDGADLLEFVDEVRGQEALAHVQPEEASDLRHLGEYGPETAGGMMTTEFIAVAREDHVGDLLKRIRRGEEGEAETIHALYITDPSGRLLGVVSARELLASPIHDPVGDHASPDVIQARADEDQEEVARRLLHYNLHTIPVVDPRGVLVGIITSDDALEVLEEEGSEDALLLAGASGDTEAGESLFRQVAHRAPMLAITVAAGLLMSRVMNLYAPESAGAEGFPGNSWFLILSYIPMVLALSGTIGSQTSALLVRGFAVGRIRPGRRRRVFVGEVKIGLTLGALTGLIAIPAAAFFAGGDWTIGFSLGLALLLAMAWAATASTLIALGSEAAGLDPALVAGPVMLAVSDLSAVLLFFGVARALFPAV